MSFRHHHLLSTMTAPGFETGRVLWMRDSTKSDKFWWPVVLFQTWEDIIHYQVPHDVNEQIQSLGEHQVLVYRLGQHSGKPLLAVDRQDLRLWESVETSAVLKHYAKIYDAADLRAAIKVAEDAMDLVIHKCHPMILIYSFFSMTFEQKEFYPKTFSPSVNV